MKELKELFSSFGSIQRANDEDLTFELDIQDNEIAILITNTETQFMAEITFDSLIDAARELGADDNVNIDVYYNGNTIDWHDHIREAIDRHGESLKSYAMRNVEKWKIIQQ